MPLWCCRQLDAHTGESLTFQEFLEHVKQVRRGLWQLGVRKGDVVFVLAPNNILTPVITFAAVSLGATFTACNHLYSKGTVVSRDHFCLCYLVFHWCKFSHPLACFRNELNIQSERTLWAGMILALLDELLNHVLDCKPSILVTTPKLQPLTQQITTVYKHIKVKVTQSNNGNFNSILWISYTEYSTIITGHMLCTLSRLFIFHYCSSLGHGYIWARPRRLCAQRQAERTLWWECPSSACGSPQWCGMPVLLLRNHRET